MCRAGLQPRDRGVRFQVSETKRQHPEARFLKPGVGPAGSDPARPHLVVTLLPLPDRLRPMRILITNDDGIDSAGLHALREIALQLSDDVWVVAPETNQSGASHSLSLHEPLRMRKIDERAFAVRGTPTDSVIMGVRHVLKEKPPQLVLSGVNRGK